jgi:hypothetical protein
MPSGGLVLDVLKIKIGTKVFMIIFISLLENRFRFVVFVVSVEYKNKFNQSKVVELCNLITS